MRHEQPLVVCVPAITRPSQMYCPPASCREGPRLPDLRVMRNVWWRACSSAKATVPLWIMASGHRHSNGCLCAVGLAH